jgi:hypothetical protein
MTSAMVDIYVSIMSYLYAGVGINFLGSRFSEEGWQGIAQVALELVLSDWT